MEGVRCRAALGGGAAPALVGARGYSEALLPLLVASPALSKACSFAGKGARPPLWGTGEVHVSAAAGAAGVPGILLCCLP